MAYSETEKAQVIKAALQSLSTGQSLNAFCKANKYPYMTVTDWLQEEETVNSAREARNTGTHYLAGECLDISDDIRVLAAQGNENIPHVIQAAKLQIDTRMRLIGKWNHKDYGDKLDTDSNVTISNLDELLRAVAATKD